MNQKSKFLPKIFSFTNNLKFKKITKKNPQKKIKNEKTPLFFLSW